MKPCNLCNLCKLCKLCEQCYLCILFLGILYPCCASNKEELVSGADFVLLPLCIPFVLSYALDNPNNIFTEIIIEKVEKDKEEVKDDKDKDGKKNPSMGATPRLPPDKEIRQSNK